MSDEEEIHLKELTEPGIRELAEGAMRAYAQRPFTEARIVFGPGMGLFIGIADDARGEKVDVYAVEGARVGDTTWSQNDLRPEHQNLDPTSRLKDWDERPNPR